MINLITIRKEPYGCLFYVNSKKMYYLIEDNALMQHFYNAEKNDKSRHIVINYLRSNNLTSKNEVLYFVDNSFTNVQMVPLEIYFDYTTKCNLKCTYCYNKDYYNKYDTLQDSDIIKILTDLYELGIMRIHLAGGEPLIYEDKLIKYVSFCNSHNMVLSMATNGTLINKSNSEFLLSNNLLSISVSLDSYDEKINDKLRGVGSYKKAINGIKTLVETKKAINSNTDICIKPVFFPDISINEIENNILMAIELGVDKIKFSNPERSTHHDPGYYFKNKSLHYSIINELLVLKTKYKEKIKIDVINNPLNHKLNIGLPNRIGCIGAQELLTINPNGIITPCLMNKQNLGLYNNYESLKQYIKNSPELINYNKKIQSNEVCKKCIIVNQCRGGCQVRKHVEKIPFNECGPYCPKAMVNQPNSIANNSTSQKHKPIYVFHSL